MSCVAYRDPWEREPGPITSPPSTVLETLKRSADQELPMTYEYKQRSVPDVTGAPKQVPERGAKRFVADRFVLSALSFIYSSFFSINSLIARSKNLSIFLSTYNKFV